MSSFLEKLNRGELPTGSEWQEHLIEAHAKAPSMTPNAFAGYRGTDGMSSYEWLASVAKGKRVLDLACGDGFLIPFLLGTAQRQVVGIDMSEAELAVARRRISSGRLKLVTGQAQRLPFDDDSFDTIVCHMAIMLVTPIEPVIAEMSRVLKKGGVFAAVVGHPKGAAGVQLELQKTIYAYVQKEFPSLADVKAGDPRTQTADGVEELFVKSGKFKKVGEFTPFDVTKRIPPAAVWNLLGNMYFLSMLPPEKYAALRADCQAVAAKHAQHGTFDYAFPLQRFIVIK